MQLEVVLDIKSIIDEKNEWHSQAGVHSNQFSLCGMYGQ